jgi:hypothetical protein
MRGHLASRDLYGGTIFVVIGLGILVQGRSYGIGSLTHVGAGLFPTVLGVVLMVLGALIALGGLWSSSGEAESDDFVPLEWRGFAAVVAGVVAFIAIGAWFGLAPAAFCCVFISALGDRHATVKSAALLALVMTMFAVGFFCYFLNIQFPVLQFPISGGNP